MTTASASRRAPRKPAPSGSWAARARQLLGGDVAIDSAAAGHASIAALDRRRRGMIRIVVADDHTIVREGLKQTARRGRDLEVVGRGADGHEVMQRVRELDFDVLLLDMSMPGKSGIELIKQVHAEKPKLRVLVLSMHEEQQYAVRAIRAGAAGYLTKEAPRRSW
jgi:CheY-like chemotaxis protein